MSNIYTKLFRVCVTVAYLHVDRMREKNPLNFKMLIVSINRKGGKNNLEALAHMSHDQSFLIQHGEVQIAGYNKWPTKHKMRKKKAH